MSENNSNKVFVSSTYEDLEFARHLVAKLLVNDFLTCAVEPECENEEIQAERTKEALSSASSCLLLFGPSGKSPWGTETVLLIIDEWEARSDEGYRLIPVSLPGGPDALPPDLPNTESLRRLQQRPGAFVKFKEDLDEEEATHKLILLLRGVDPDEQPLWAQDEFGHYINECARNAFDVNWRKFATEARSVFLHTGEQSPGGHLLSDELAAELTWLNLLSDESTYASRLPATIADGERTPQQDSSASFKVEPESLERPLSEVLACHKSTEELLGHPEFMERGRLICRTLVLNQPDAKDLYTDAEEFYQDVCFKIWQSARHSSHVYRTGNVCDFFHWFRQVAHNILLDASRKRGAPRLAHSSTYEAAARELLARIPSGANRRYAVLREAYKALSEKERPALGKLCYAPPCGPPRVFISYARQDVSKVAGLYKWLQASGFRPWMDMHDVYAGQRWKPLIEETIDESDFLLVCLSDNSAGKSGALHAEIREALEVWQEKSRSDTYVIPVLLEECHLPQRFSHLQQVELFEAGGWSQLSTVLRAWNGLDGSALPSATDPVVSPFGIFFHPNQGLLAAGEPLRRMAACEENGTDQFHDGEMGDVYDLYNACKGKMHAGLLDIRELNKLNPEEMRALNVVRLRKVWDHIASGCQTCENIIRVLNTTHETLHLGVDQPYQTENDFEDDIAVFETFRDQWDAKTLTEAHPVMNMVEHWAKVVAFKHGCASQYADLRDEALLSLATEGHYAGQGSLKGYVLRVLISKVPVVKAPLVKAPRKPRNGENSGLEEPFKHKYVLLDDSDETSIMDLPDERSDKLADKVLLRIAYDRELREKIAALPDLQRVIVDIVNEHEERLSTRHIAKEAAKRLGRNVTRHQIEIALEQLVIVVGASLWRT